MTQFVEHGTCNARIMVRFPGPPIRKMVERMTKSLWIKASTKWRMLYFTRRKLCPPRPSRPTLLYSTETPLEKPSHARWATEWKGNYPLPKTFIFFPRHQKGSPDMV